MVLARSVSRLLLKKTDVAKSKHQAMLRIFSAP